MLRYMLDTNVVIDVIRRRPLSLLQKFNEHSAGIVLAVLLPRSCILAWRKAQTPPRISV